MLFSVVLLVFLTFNGMYAFMLTEPHQPLTKMKPRIQFVIKPDDQITVEKGTTKSVHCSIASVPGGYIQWKKNNKYIGEKFNWQENGMYNSGIVTSTLEIQCSGIYKCIGSNSFEEIHAEFTVTNAQSDCTTSPLALPIYTHSDFVFGKIGNTVTLYCHSNVDNKSWTWMKDSNQIQQNERISSGRDGRLIIKDLQIGDKANYKCNTKTENGFKSLIITLLPVF